MNHTYVCTSDNRLAKKMKTEIFTNLSKRYSEDLLLLFSKAAFLDPNFKSLPFLSTSETEELHTSIKEEVNEHAHANVNQTNKCAPPAAKTAKGEHEILELIDDLMHPNE